MTQEEMLIDEVIFWSFVHVMFEEIYYYFERNYSFLLARTLLKTFGIIYEHNSTEYITTVVTFFRHFDEAMLDISSWWTGRFIRNLFIFKKYSILKKEKSFLILYRPGF